MITSALTSFNLSSNLISCGIHSLPSLYQILCFDIKNNHPNLPKIENLVYSYVATAILPGMLFNKLDATVGLSTLSINCILIPKLQSSPYFRSLQNQVSKITLTNLGRSHALNDIAKIIAKVAYSKIKNIISC